MYSNGEGVTQENEEAFTWFMKAADQGHADAQYKVGLLYYEGKGIAQDLEKVRHWVAESGGTRTHRSAECPEWDLG